MEYQDITGDIGNLFGSAEPKYPMYSYDRPAYLFWQGAYEGMREKGKSHDEAMKILQSKSPRWTLDFHQDAVQNLGRGFADFLIENYNG